MYNINIMDINTFKQLPILGILRGINESVVEPLVEAIVDSGLKTIEITMNTQGAPALIKKTIRAANSRLIIGAGTVLKMDDLHAALDAGASFIVMPALIDDVTQYCVKNSIPVFPGALTPQEIYNAWQAGATMVKVFPASLFAPEYFKEVLGPFQNIELLACGGISPENISSYFSCGASAVAFGGSIFKAEWLNMGDFSSICKSIKALIRGFN
jgi:2-dehydro-3-deoxyphosphogluconate aldolase / (4S)-4-hydroxy-2-oxoglutarate aldolase